MTCIYSKIISTWFITENSSGDEKMYQVLKFTVIIKRWLVALAKGLYISLRMVTNYIFRFLLIVTGNVFYYLLLIL